MFIKENQDNIDEQNSVLLNNLIQCFKEERESSFRVELAEDLGVSSEVVSTIMNLEYAKSLRKRLKLLTELKETKKRIFQALLLASDEDELSHEDQLLFNSSVSVEELRSHIYNLVFQSRTSEEEIQENRRREQSSVKSFIRFHLAKCQANASDMQELIEWMGKFTFELTWEDIDIKPLDVREKEEEERFSAMVSSLRRAWSCTKSLTDLVEKMASDDDFDYISGELPPHLLEGTKKEVSRVWSSSKLRTKLKRFEKLRSEIKVDRKFPERAVMDRQITVLSPEETSKPTPLKELEGVILREISNSWKKASGDVAFYVKETLHHRFTKPSCRKRLKRALLLLEFLNAAIEGKLIEADKTLEALKEAQSSAVRIKRESTCLHNELSEKNKHLNTARQNIAKLKTQIKAISKENEKLQSKKNENLGQIDELQQEVFEYKSRPTKEELEECLLQITALEDEINKFKARENEMKDIFDQKNKYYEELVSELSSKQSSQVMLEDELAAISYQNKKATHEIMMLKEQLKKQRQNVLSAEHMMDDEDRLNSEASFDESSKFSKRKRNRKVLMQAPQKSFRKKDSEENDDDDDNVIIFPHHYDDDEPILLEPQKISDESLDKKVKDKQNIISEQEKTKKKASMRTNFKKDKPFPLDHLVQGGQIENKEEKKTVIASEPETSMKTSSNRTTDPNNIKPKKSSKKKKEILNRKLNAFAQIMTDEITEAFVDNYPDMHDEADVGEKNEFLKMIQSVKLNLNEETGSKPNDLTSDYESHATKNNQNTSNTIEPSLKFSTYSSYATEIDRAKDEESNIMTPQLRTQSDNARVELQEVLPSLINSEESEFDSDVDEEKSFFNPSAGSNLLQTDDDTNDAENEIIKKQKLARFGNRNLSLFHDLCKRETSSSPMFLESARVQILPRPNSKEQVVSFSRPFVKKLRRNSPVSSADEDENPDLPSEAKEFAKRISRMIHEYFSKLNKKLVESLKRDKKKLEIEIEKMKETMVDERTYSQSAIDKLKKDNDEMEMKLKQAKGNAGKIIQVSKWSSRSGELPKMVKEVEEEKLRLIKFSQDLSNSAFRNKSLADKAYSELELTKKKMKTSEMKLSMQYKKIENLRHQLNDIKQKDMRKLFLSIGNHKFNYKTIEERTDIDSDIKQVVLDLLKRSMSYPQHCFSQLVYRYAQKKEIESCMTKINYQISDVIHLPPVDMSATNFSRKFNVEEKEKLRQILSKLKSRCEVADEKWKSRMKEITGRRQKILKNLILLFHKLTSEIADISLIEPTIISKTASARPPTRRKMNRKYFNHQIKLPVIPPQVTASRRTMNSPESFPSKIQVPLFRRDSKGMSTISLSSHELNVDRFAQNFERTLKQPLQRSSCPFRNESGRVNLYRNVSCDTKQQKQWPLLFPTIKWPVSDSAVTGDEVAVVPRMLEMDVQSGLRHAKRSVFARLTSSDPGAMSYSLQSNYQKNTKMQIPIFSSKWRESLLENDSSKNSSIQLPRVDKETSRTSFSEKIVSSL